MVEGRRVVVLLLVEVCGSQLAELVLLKVALLAGERLLRHQKGVEVSSLALLPSERRRVCRRARPRVRDAPASGAPARPELIVVLVLVDVGRPGGGGGRLAGGPEILQRTAGDVHGVGLREGARSDGLGLLDWFLLRFGAAAHCYWVQ